MWCDENRRSYRFVCVERAFHHRAEAALKRGQRHLNGQNFKNESKSEWTWHRDTGRSKLTCLCLCFSVEELFSCESPSLSFSCWNTHTLVTSSFSQHTDRTTDVIKVLTERTDLRWGGGGERILQELCCDSALLTTEHWKSYSCDKASQSHKQRRRRSSPLTTSLWGFHCWQTVRHPWINYPTRRRNTQSMLVYHNKCVSALWSGVN